MQSRLTWLRDFFFSSDIVCSMVIICWVWTLMSSSRCIIKLGNSNFSVKQTVPPVRCVCICVFFFNLNSRIAGWLERRTQDQKVASSDPSWRGGRIFFSRANFMCWLLFGAFHPPLLPKWHVKHPHHSAKRAGGRLIIIIITIIIKYLFSVNL